MFQEKEFRKINYKYLSKKILTYKIYSKLIPCNK